MKAARIMVFFEEQLVEDCVLKIRKPIVLGDDSDAVVHFPGWTIKVAPDGSRLAIDGDPLEYNQPATFQWSGVRVVVEAVRTYEMPRDPIWETDLRFPVLMMSVFLLLMSVQSLSNAVAVQMDRGPLMVAGWTLLVPEQSEPTTDANPNFDLEALDRMGTFQDVHIP